MDWDNGFRLIFKQKNILHKSYYEQFGDGSVKCIDEEIPFEIPESWEWERIGNIAFVTKLAGFEYTKYFTKDNILAENTIPLVRAQNVKMGVYHENTQDAIDLALSILLDRCALTKKCLLMTFIGAGIGDVCIFPNNKRSHLAPNVAKIEFYSNLSLEYALIYLMSSTGQQEIVNIRKSTAQPSLSMATIRNILIPVPPVNEQIRIQENANTFFTLTTDIERDKFELEQFIKQAKSKILDLAIRGNLVPQDPNDEPASVLLERIKTEHPESKKKAKNISDNSHYGNLDWDVPSNWCWCLLSDISSFERGITFPSSAKSTYQEEHLLPCIRTANVQEQLELEDLWYIDPIYTKNNNDKLIRNGDIIMSSANSRELVGKTSYVQKIEQRMTFGGFVLSIRAKGIESKYLFHLLRCYFGKGIFMTESTQTTNIANINAVILGNLKIPLPPRNEQLRIISQIELIFKYIDNIRANL